MLDDADAAEELAAALALKGWSQQRVLLMLRVREPELARPFRVPGGLVGAVALGVGPIALLGVALVKNADERVAGMNALVFGLGVILMLCVVLYVLPSTSALGAVLLLAMLRRRDVVAISEGEVAPVAA